MISRALYDKVEARYGSVASWAVWEPQGDRPKSNMGAHNVFNLEKNRTLLDTLRNDTVMLGLNLSREVKAARTFSNFHDESPHANDFKIRYAFEGTPYYGSYMTDVLKNLVIPDSQDVRRYLSNNPALVEPHIAALVAEFADLECERPTLLAFGRDAYGLLADHLDKRLYRSLIRLTHYSHQMNKEKYRVEVLSQIAGAVASVS